MNDISQRYDKDVVVVETAYAFTLDDLYGHQNIFTAYEEEVSGYPATPEGQSRFLYDVMEIVRNVPDERGLGIFYWEPAWLGVDGAGWTAGEGNAWENQALFDFDGNALPGLLTFSPGYVPPEVEPRESEDEEPDEELEGRSLLSRDKPATASSSAGTGGGKNNAPENAVEDDDNTSWGIYEGVGAWWQVDFEEEVTIELIDFDFWNGKESILMEASDDGDTFTEVGEFNIEDSSTRLDLRKSRSPRSICA